MLLRIDNASIWRSGTWDPDHLDGDRRSRDALAARGYWQAFNIVKKNIEDILGGASPGPLVLSAHRDWYRELFQPCVGAGLIDAKALVTWGSSVGLRKNL